MDDKEFEKGLDSVLKNVEKEARTKVDAREDAGHNALISDLDFLLEEAKECQFHDFLNTRYAAPKMALHTRLLELDKKMQDGAYVN